MSSSFNPQNICILHLNLGCTYHKILKISNSYIPKMDNIVVFWKAVYSTVETEF